MKRGRREEKMERREGERTVTRGAERRVSLEEDQEEEEAACMRRSAVAGGAAAGGRGGGVQ